MSATGAVFDDFRPETPRSLNLNAWNEIKVDFDPTLNTQSTYINGALLSTGTWSNGVGSAMELACVDLWANNTAGGVFYDNMSVVPEPSTLIALSVGALALLRRRRR